MEAEISKVLDLCAGIGRLLLENGAETYRVEDTIYRVATHYGFKNVHVFSVPNTIIFTVETPEEHEHTRLQRVFSRDTNLGKVRDGNELSRAITAGGVTVEEAQARLDAINQSKNFYSLGFKAFMAGLSCAFFALIFSGGLPEWLMSFGVGAAGYSVHAHLSKMTNVQFFSEMMGSFIIGWLAVLCSFFILPNNINIVIIASIMPLVPGRAITNGIRDLMAGDYVSGLSIIADALLSATAIGVGVAGVLAMI
ncbi:threonine/serine exporter family protein [Allofustis seminis]|uniref:threonine/serine exporter family protein n=1 Tax=Allofustis seminis TaxID=166939 RepID=UPI00036D85C5|nr:threonine/serine exporter family protein [Allofustis seminis]